MSALPQRTEPWISRRERVVNAVKPRVDPDIRIDDQLIWAIDEFCKILIDKPNGEVIFRICNGVVVEIEGRIPLRRSSA